ncbi:GIY-YIG nuclease family protein [Candidatus Peregrinibacteria bacterium]|nr:GIY-YIG nuclease family protein [Candidatus Peregrinibacteria bacterium]
MIDKKAAIRKYKETIQPMGIYQIKNLSNGKVFIDSSKNLNGAKNRSMLQLGLGSHMNLSLQADYTCLGENQFAFEILDQLKPKEDLTYDYTDDLKTLKTLWLEKLQPYGEKGYNAPVKSVK